MTQGRGDCIVRIKRKSGDEKWLKEKAQVSGSAHGTVFGGLLEAFDDMALADAPLCSPWRYALTRKTYTTPFL